MRPDVETMQGMKARGTCRLRSVGLAVSVDLAAGRVFQSVCGFVLSAHVFRLLMKFASYMCSFSLDIEVEEPEAGEFG